MYYICGSEELMSLKRPIIPKLIFKSNTILTQIPADSFEEIDKVV